MEARIDLVPTSRKKYLNHKEFHSGVVEAIKQLVEELAKPKKNPRSLASRLKKFFEPLRFSDKFDSNSVSQVCESVSRLLVRLTEEDLNQIQSGVRSDEFKEFVKNLRQGLEGVLESLSKDENHPLNTFLKQTDASSVLGKIYGANILVLFAAWANGVEDFSVPGQGSFITKGCCIPIVRILLEETLSIPHDTLKTATKDHIEGAAIALGAQRSEALEQP